MSQSSNSPGNHLGATGSLLPVPRTRVPRQPRPPRRRAAASGPVLTILAILLFAAAAWLLFRGWNNDTANIPDTPDSGVAFICESCGKDFTLTGREIHEAMNHYDPRSDPRGSASKFPCKHCGKRAGIRPPEEGLEPE